jgi:hypothetical protein
MTELKVNTKLIPELDGTGRARLHSSLVWTLRVQKILAPVLVATETAVCKKKNKNFGYYLIE